MNTFTSTPWRVTIVAVALVLTFGGDAVAKGTYDANHAKNSDKVDGIHAVTSSTSVTRRKGRLVATDPRTGRLPANIVGTVSKATNAAKLGGYTHGQLATMSIPPQSGYFSGTLPSSAGPFLDPSGSSSVDYSFVVPPDHNPATDLSMDVVYLDNDAGACSWHAYAQGIEGPDSTTGADVHNGGWLVPGSSGYDGPVSVPAGQGSVHTATFTWPFDDNPGMFINFELRRDGAATDDTCDAIQIVGLQLRY